MGEIVFSGLSFRKSTGEISITREQNGKSATPGQTEAQIALSIINCIHHAIFNNKFSRKLP